jgi:hypothetical protein
MMEVVHAQMQHRGPTPDEERVMLDLARLYDLVHHPPRRPT